LKKKSGKMTIVEKNIESVAAPIRAKKNNMGKKADVEMHRVSVAEPTSEKSKTRVQGML
ncbi:hypothetical protein Tco_1231930, partial [Tanacetum coccineum]